MSFKKLLPIFFIIFTTISWKTTGHFLVAAVAERVLKNDRPKLLTILDGILSELSKYTKADKYNFIECATFLDDIKYIDVKMFNRWHYVTQPYLTKEAKAKLS